MRLRNAPLPTRFDLKWAPDKATGCFLWHGTKGSTGYGVIRVGRGKVQWIYAHRFAWERVHGLVPAGLELDHMCRVRACVNPDHLRAVTHAENMRAARGTHCERGHPYPPFETERRPRRDCRLCRLVRASIRRAALVGVEPCLNFDAPPGRGYKWHRGHGCYLDDGKPARSNPSAEAANV